MAMPQPDLTNCTCETYEFVFGVQRLFTEGCPVHLMETDTDEDPDDYRDLLIDRDLGVS